MKYNKKKISIAILIALILIITFGSLLFQFIQQNKIKQDQGKTVETVQTIPINQNSVQNNDANYKSEIQKYITKLQGRKLPVNSQSLVYNLLDTKGEPVNSYRIYKEAGQKDSEGNAIIENGFVRDGFDKLKRFTISNTFYIPYDSNNSEKDPLFSLINAYYPKDGYNQLNWKYKWDDYSISNKEFPHKIIAAFPDKKPDEKEIEKATNGLYLFTREYKGEEGLYVWDIEKKQKVKISEKICRFATFNKGEILCLEGLNLYGLSGEKTIDYGNFQQCVEGVDKLYCNRSAGEVFEIDVNNPNDQKLLYKAKDKESIGFVSYSHLGEVFVQIITGSTNATSPGEDLETKGKQVIKTVEIKDGNLKERVEFKDLIVLF